MEWFQKVKKFVVNHQEEILFGAIVLAEVVIIIKVGDAVYNAGFHDGATLRKLPSDIFIETMTSDAGHVVYFLNGMRYDILPK